MGDFESIVRPFATPEIRPPYVATPQSPPEPDDSDTIVWGNSGDNVFQLQAHVTQDVRPATWPEISRKYDVIRVTDPDNSDNHLDVEVMTQFKGRNKYDKSLFQMDITRTEPSENVEILSRNNTRKTAD